MEMRNKAITSFIPGVGFALLLNIFLFAILPQFTERGANKNDLETLIPVNIIQFKRPEPIPPEEEKRDLLNKKEPEKIIPTVRLQVNKEKIHKKLDLDVKMPSLNLEINPRLKMGTPISLPPKENVIATHSGSYNQGEVDESPVVISSTKPFYPFRARMRNVTGEVEVKFLVNKNGNVGRIIILESNPKGTFDRSVIRSLSSWRFMPGKVQGKAVSTWVITTIKFRLEG